MLKELFRQALDDFQAAATASLTQIDLLVATGRMMAQSLTDGGVIYICGNGGSAAESQHLAAELVGRFLMKRPGLAAIALTADTSKLTAIGNDYGYEEVFARQLEALGRPGDVLWVLSTSGKSPNVLKALQTAKSKGLKTVFMCGPKVMDPMAADYIIPAPGATTPRVQEMHLFYGHFLCQIVERLIFAGPEKSM
ncbi:MAG: SIS domain-containing protein [Deltaproteobacteria bacterium]|jgi:D-sedoheptulose 7-phosphate isomerase|nr:SIS domain-containing protein [Deltaproteobacteria bacterium]